MNSCTRTLLAMALTASFAGTALAEGSHCTNAAKSEWMSLDAVKSKAESVGYNVRSIKLEGTCYEAKAIIDGKRREIVFNPVNGKLVDGNEQN